MEDNLELIRWIRNGDEEAFARLVRNHHRMIYRIIYNHRLDTGDYRIDAEDLYQEGCLALYGAVFTFEEKRGVRFSTYAYMVISSRIKSVLRSHYRSANRDLYSLDRCSDHDMNLCVRQDPSQYHREERFREELERFISTLDPQDREILKMKEEDCSYKQISERLRINVKKVDNRLRYLKKRLREKMGD